MRRFFILVILLNSMSLGWANNPPVMTDLSVVQRPDHSGIVDIDFTLKDADGDACLIMMKVSNDSGRTWTITPSASALSGDWGHSVHPGKCHIEWATKTDLPGSYGEKYRIRLIAEDGYDDPIPPIIPLQFVAINDPGVAGHEGFNGEMSKYETTNAQYCQYLNAALADGIVTVYKNRVYACADTGHSEPYFDTIYGSDYSQIDYSEGVFSVSTRDGYSMNNHPVVEVTWYGAVAFAAYYGYRLPTEWEWQAVADYDGSFEYGCGQSINPSLANYWPNNPLGLTSYPYTLPVDYYPAYGYGLCQMAGNASEWTSSLNAGSNRVIRGGSWYNYVTHCSVFHKENNIMNDTSRDIGFRVCR